MASNTDKLLKVAPNTGWQISAGGVADASVTTIPLVSSTGLPTDTAVLLTIDRVDNSGNKTPSKMERVLGVVSGNNVINCLRGVEGTAQAHSGGAIVEIVISSININNIVDWGGAEHNQDGTHNLSAFTQADIVDLLRGDGWKTISATATYVSATTFYLAGDWTGRLQKGDKLKLTNSSLKYFYVISLGAYDSVNDRTLITTTGENDLVSGAISGVYFSKMESPQGFPNGRDKYKCSVYRSTDQINIPQNEERRVTFNAERYDIGSNFNTISDNVFFAPISGYYQINFGIGWRNMTIGENCYAYIKRNTTLLHSFGPVVMDIAFGRQISGGATIYLEKGNYIDLTTKHDGSGSSQDIASDTTTFLTIDFISV